MQPNEQKELISLVVRKAEVKDRELVLELYGGVCALPSGTPESLLSGARFSQTPGRLPALVAASVLVDCSPLHLKSLTRFRLEVISERLEQGRDHTALQWQAMLERGEVKNRAELARTLGLSRARVTQVLGSRA